ncbi:MAG: hypothetical protein ACYSWZ_04705 [Planctomycetota bacterium]
MRNRRSPGVVAPHGPVLDTMGTIVRYRPTTSRLRKGIETCPGQEHNGC